MSEYDEFKARSMIIRQGIGRILDSLDTKAMEEVDKRIEDLGIDIDYLCDYPDVFCTILKIACGKSYVDVIRSASEMEENLDLDSKRSTSQIGPENF